MPADPAWTDENLSDPHAVADKAQRVERMFAAIAPRYDLNNRLHSLWRDQAWRRAAVKLAQLKSSDTVLDVACGTGDLAMKFAEAGAHRVMGLDFTHEMLTLAQQKAPQLNFQRGDAMNLPVADASVDVVSIAFGLRNVADPRKALAEFHRVLLPGGGRLIVLEFATPGNPLVRFFDRIYREKIMPVTASWIAGDKVGAYRYLPRSVSTFADPRKMAQMLGEAGFREVTIKPMTCGIAVAYRGVKA
ncbi:MAG: bifunctional demethylmenaquinone methyltransferase/2-methoxy-6-polyprenyl-1,4-benzoquinol methylase UbiE [Phycisphaeraceae bacterium]|nr:bifunctional demethylmenaquinone methyltransferase/2-methoxy-6-polyprenyl-1,4-benzoquinol methylase UbiE [Phycisphaeraceae bacterium]